MRAIGIDPGVATSGWGLVEVYGRHGRAILWGEIPSTREAFAALYQEHRPDLVSVEEAVILRIQASKEILKVAAVADRAVTVAGMLDIATTLIPQARWRRIVGVPARKNGTTMDAHVDRVLRMRMAGFPAPKKSKDHMRDALGVGLAGCLTSTVKQLCGTWIHGGGQR